MRYERICPLCGGTIRQRNEVCEKTQERPGYGKMLSLDIFCDCADCGFTLAFPFDAELYVKYVTETLRVRIRQLPPDERVSAMLASLSYCRRSAEDALSVRIFEQVNVIFMEALGEILKDTRQMLRALSFREPDPDTRRRTRQDLGVFLRLLQRMEGNYPTPRLESEFTALKEGLRSLDYYYELGMLALESDPKEAERLFAAGKNEGGIRSRVAYVKHILASRAETPEERDRVKHEFSALAPYSQEAVHECICRAETGKDELLIPLKAYLSASYPSLSYDGKLSFLRLLLGVGIECCEPALRSTPIFSSGTFLDTDAYQHASAILSELSELTEILIRECEALLASIDSLEGESGESSELAAALAAAKEENALIEYLIGCCMYYRSRMDLEKRFDNCYLRETIGHFAAFLSSDLMKPASSEELDLPSLIGFLNLREVRERAIGYQTVLEEEE